MPLDRCKNQILVVMHEVVKRTSTGTYLFGDRWKPSFLMQAGTKKERVFRVVFWVIFGVTKELHGQIRLFKESFPCREVWLGFITIFDVEVMILTRTQCCCLLLF